MLKVPLPDRVEIWRKYWLLRVPIDPIRFKGTEGGVPSWSWPTVKKVAREFLELGEPDVRALENPLLLEKWRELMTALDLGESEVRALKYPLLLERWRELKSGEDIGEDNVDQGGEEHEDSSPQLLYTIKHTKDGEFVRLPDSELSDREVRVVTALRFLSDQAPLPTESANRSNTAQGGEEPLYEQYEDSPVARFLPLVRVVARSGMKGGVYGGELEARAASPVLGRREKRQNPPLPSFLKRHIEFMERIVNA